LEKEGAIERHKKQSSERLPLPIRDCRCKRGSKAPSEYDAGVSQDGQRPAEVDSQMDGAVSSPAAESKAAEPAIASYED